MGDKGEIEYRGVREMGYLSEFSPARDTQYAILSIPDSDQQYTWEQASWRQADRQGGFGRNCFGK